MRGMITYVISVTITAVNTSVRTSVGSDGDDGVAEGDGASGIGAAVVVRAFLWCAYASLLYSTTFTHY